MRDGVALLARDRDAAMAFRLANRAMLRQMEHFGDTSDAPCRWRPFQLGFLLASIASTIREDDPNRETLDLIWFQTGGGKTEAYLGLIAFLLVWRRLRYGASGGGTAVFMRYTLRLLTRQQFERAAGLICALELIRRRDARADGRLGEEPFSVGIWVGRGVCPKHHRGRGSGGCARFKRPARAVKRTRRPETACSSRAARGAGNRSTATEGTVSAKTTSGSIAQTGSASSASAARPCPAAWSMSRSTGIPLRS